MLNNLFINPSALYIADLYKVSKQSQTIFDGKKVIKQQTEYVDTKIFYYRECKYEHKYIDIETSICYYTSAKKVGEMFVDILSLKHFSNYLKEKNIICKSSFLSKGKVKKLYNIANKKDIN